MTNGSRRILCLGEALVDLICERPITSVGEVDALVPHFGGAVANVALMAARAGAEVALAGGAGDDDWGRWLQDQMATAGVDLRWFELIPEARTPMAITTIDPHGEPIYDLYGEMPATVAHALADVVGQAVEHSGGLFLSSNVLAGIEEREVAMAARQRALDLSLPVIFDPNLRLHRWRSRADAAASANACVPGALLVRCTLAEAQLMTGEDDLERAALALRKAGARNVVITLGVDGAIVRGKIRQDVPGVPARVISTVGAGDALMATLLARLQITGFYEPAIAASLREAVEVSARACERWGACD